jgi:alkyl hydroperoxide reductase subunit AhpF
LAIISTDDAAKVRAYFLANLQDSVTMDLFSQTRSPLVVPGRHECEYCAETEQLLGEIAALSDKVALSIHDLRANPEAGAADGIGPDLIPAIVLRGSNRGAVRYFGIPTGYEFTTILQSLVDVSTGATKLSDATRTALADLPSDVHIRVFVTPT